jgi:hypothetical protein
VKEDETSLTKNAQYAYVMENNFSAYWSSNGDRRVSYCKCVTNTEKADKWLFYKGITSTLTAKINK